MSLTNHNVVKVIFYAISFNPEVEDRRGSDASDNHEPHYFVNRKAILDEGVIAKSAQRYHCSNSTDLRCICT